MTDKISDFFKDIKDRLSSPFFSSFIIAWLIINWKVPVALLWYNQAELEKAGYKSHFELIKQVYNGWGFIWLPILSALAYCFVYPFFKNLLLIFNAWNKTWGSHKIYSVSKSSYVSMDKYLEQRDKLELSKKQLTDLLSHERRYKDLNATLTAEKNKLETEKKVISESLSKWTQGNDIEILERTSLLLLKDANGNIDKITIVFKRETLSLFYENDLAMYEFTNLYFSYNAIKNTMTLLFKGQQIDMTMVQILYPTDASFRTLKGTMYLSDNLMNWFRKTVLLETHTYGNPIEIEYTFKDPKE